MQESVVFAAESVAEGNPHKVADQLADAVLDSLLARDRHARVACKVLVSTGLVLVAGEVTTEAWVDMVSVVRSKLKEIGYDDAALGFEASSCAVMNLLQEQGGEIRRAVDRRGAGDLCTVIGYASDEGEGLTGGCDLMPVPIFLAHSLAGRLASVRRSAALPWLRPDGKVQVCLEYGDDGRPRRIVSVTVCAQHAPDVEMEQVRSALRREVVDASLLETGLLDGDAQIWINPAGPFTQGGPQVDCGLSGAKPAVDGYGTACRQSDGALSGKDPTKPERSGAYMARHVAKSLVASGLVHRCEVRLTYIIGREQPVAVQVEAADVERDLEALVRERFELSVPGIIEAFDLRRPIYSPLACRGHFGRRDLNLPWEQVVGI